MKLRYNTPYWRNVGVAQVNTEQLKAGMNKLIAAVMGHKPIVLRHPSSIALAKEDAKVIPPIADK